MNSESSFHKRFHLRDWKYLEYFCLQFKVRGFLANHDEWDGSSTEQDKVQIHTNYLTALHRWSWTSTARCCSKLASIATTMQYSFKRDFYYICRLLSKTKESPNYSTSLQKIERISAKADSRPKIFSGSSLSEETVYAMPTMKYLRNVRQQLSATIALKTPHIMWCYDIQLVPA